MDTVAINRARIIYYRFFSALFAFKFDEQRYQTISLAVELLGQAPLDDQSGLAFTNMARRLGKGGYPALKKENDRIFSSPTTPQMPMTASYYDEGRDDGRKRVEMINLVLATRYRRDSEKYKENEDHIEFVMELLARLVEDTLAGEKDAQDLSIQVLTTILNPMADAMLEKLYDHPESRFYKQAAIALAAFIAFERLYCHLPEPETQHAARPDHPTAPNNTGKCVQFGQGACV